MNVKIETRKVGPFWSATSEGFFASKLQNHSGLFSPLEKYVDKKWSFGFRKDKVIKKVQQEICNHIARYEKKDKVTDVTTFDTKECPKHVDSL